MTEAEQWAVGMQQQRRRLFVRKLPQLDSFGQPNVCLSRKLSVAEGKRETDGLVSYV